MSRYLENQRRPPIPPIRTDVLTTSEDASAATSTGSALSKSLQPFDERNDSPLIDTVNTPLHRAPSAPTSQAAKGHHLPFNPFKAGLVHQQTHRLGQPFPIPVRKESVDSTTPKFKVSGTGSRLSTSKKEKEPQDRTVNTPVTNHQDLAFPLDKEYIARIVKKARSINRVLEEHNAAVGRSSRAALESYDTAIRRFERLAEVENDNENATSIAEAEKKWKTSNNVTTAAAAVKNNDGDRTPIASAVSKKSSDTVVSAKPSPVKKWSGHNFLTHPKLRKSRSYPELPPLEYEADIELGSSLGSGSGFLKKLAKRFLSNDSNNPPLPAWAKKRKTASDPDRSKSDSPKPPPTPRTPDLEVFSDIVSGDAEYNFSEVVGRMNNFSNFDGNPNANIGRPAPSAAQAQQMNGMNAATQWPNVGAQSDMNVLWEYIVKLSEMHEQIRQQTQQVASGMQQIGDIRRDGGSSSTIPHINGAGTALLTSASENAEIASLQHDLAAANAKIEDMNSYVSSLQTLNQDFESALSHTLDKLRPFAQNHAQALNAQKAHYLNLLEVERSQNLELRLEQSRWQENAATVKDHLLEALKLQNESELPFLKKIARLKADNRSLRRLCGVPLMEDSDEEVDEQQPMERSQIVRRRETQSPPDGGNGKQEPNDGAGAAREIEEKMKSLGTKE